MHLVLFWRCRAEQITFFHKLPTWHLGHALRSSILFPANAESHHDDHRLHYLLFFSAPPPSAWLDTHCSMQASQINIHLIAHLVLLESGTNHTHTGWWQSLQIPCFATWMGGVGRSKLSEETLLILMMQQLERWWDLKDKDGYRRSNRRSLQLSALLPSVASSRCQETM